MEPRRPMLALPRLIRAGGNTTGKLRKINTILTAQSEGNRRLGGRNWPVRRDVSALSRAHALPFSNARQTTVQRFSRGRFPLRCR